MGCVSGRASHAHDSTRVKSAKETSPILHGFGNLCQSAYWSIAVWNRILFAYTPRGGLIETKYL